MVEAVEALDEEEVALVVVAEAAAVVVVVLGHSVITAMMKIVEMTRMALVPCTLSSAYTPTASL